MTEVAKVKCHCNTHSPGNLIGYIGIWGNAARVEVNQCLGLGVKCPKGYGLKKALYEAAFGYVSGFRGRDIAYYVITRSLSKRIRDYALLKEKPKRDEEFRHITLARGERIGLTRQDLERYLDTPFESWKTEQMSQIYLDIRAGASAFRSSPWPSP